MTISQSERMSDAAMSNPLGRYDRVALIGAGVIGASWAALFVAHGLKVTVCDPRADAEAEVRGVIERSADTLKTLGLTPGLAIADLRFETDVETAVAGCSLVQENGPERLDFKQQLWPRIQVAAAPGALLLSSSSAIPATKQAVQLSDASRLLVGHPFNPPHIVPLVEVVPGEATSQAAVDEAVAFYRALGKVPQVLKKEIPGFVANRLQSAIFRECVHLVREGVVRIDELDSIVTQSIGLRWAVGGPFVSFHLGGGEGGLAAFIKQFGPGMEARWKSLGNPSFDAPTTEMLLNQIAETYGREDRASLEMQRDRAQLAALTAIRQSSGS